ncbi:MAG: Fibronectin type-III protein, partial [Patescibacteria group bacterium]|nr:Fibronectin type-III protein [Patescibacteria group bacterium]
MAAKGSAYKEYGVLTISLIFTLFAGSLYLHNNASALSGSGTGEQPYSIASCSQLQDVNNDLDSVYELTSNIDCSGMDPGRIGSEAAPFTGEFRGNGHTIANITVVTTDNGMGLFGYTSEASIYNLVLDNIYIGGIDSVGALIGSANYTNVWYVSVINSNITGTGQHTGGIVGYLGGSTVSRSYIDESSVTGNAQVGGIAGTVIGPSSVADSYAMPGSTPGVVGSTNVGGIAGQFGPGPAIIANTYADRTLVGLDQSSFSPTDSHLATGPISPISWDFDTVWLNTNPFPTLRPFPQMLCEAPNSTISTIESACETEHALVGDATWEIQYAFADSSDWTSLPDQNGPGFDATATNTLPGTEYRMRFRFIWSGLTSGWGSQEFLTLGDSDVDDDGTSNKEESLGPNSGDANNDGTQDYLQANVTSLLSFISGQYIALETSCDNNFNIQIGLESDSQVDINYDYPTGLVYFVARGCNVGSTQTFSVYFYGDYSDQLAVRKTHSTGYL